MKRFIKSFTSFTRNERIGLAGLCAILIILLVIRATMLLWVHPDVDKVKDKQLVTAWETFKRAQPRHTTDSAAQRPKDFQDAGDEQTSPLPDSIDINTADSATLVRLKGIGPVTAGKIMQRRKTKGPFTNISQLSETGSFTKATLDMLSKHIVFQRTTK